MISWQMVKKMAHLGSSNAMMTMTVKLVNGESHCGLFENFKSWVSSTKCLSIDLVATKRALVVASKDDDDYEGFLNEFGRS